MQDSSAEEAEASEEEEEQEEEELEEEGLQQGSWQVASGAQASSRLRELLSRVVRKDAPAPAAAAPPPPPPRPPPQPAAQAFRGLGFAAASASAAVPSGIGNGSSSSSSSSAPIPKLAAFEKHTKGFASKYLAKFNFEGRLGKESQGITKPIEVQVRPNNLGMGFGGFKEATTIKANREVERELGRGDPAAAAAEAAEEAAAQAAADAAASARRGKKAAAGSKDARAEGASARAAHPRRARPAKAQVYTTAAAVLAAAQAGDASGAAATYLPSLGGRAGGGDRVIDMRGPAARIFSSLREAGSDLGGAPGAAAAAAAAAGRPAPTSASPLLCKELLHSLNTLADAAQVELTVAARRLGAARAMAGRLQGERSALLAEKEGAARESGVLEGMQGGAEALAAFVQRGCAAVDEQRGVEVGAASAAAASAAAPPLAAAAAPLAAMRALCALFQGFLDRYVELVGRATAASLVPGVAAPRQAQAQALSTLLHDRLFPALLALLLRRVAGVWCPPVTAAQWAAEQAEWRAGQAAAGLAQQPQGASADAGDAGGEPVTPSLLSCLRFCLVMLPPSPTVQAVREAIQAALLSSLHRALSGAAALQGGDGAWTFLKQDPGPLLHLLTSLAPFSAFAEPALLPASTTLPAACAARFAGLPLHPPSPAAADLLLLPSYASLLLHTVLPALLELARQWSPDSDATPLHTWALAWGSQHLLGSWHAGGDKDSSSRDSRDGSSPVDILWASLRARIQDLLASTWHPSDDSALHMLLPWKSVWGGGKGSSSSSSAWSGLLQRGILPKLGAALREACSLPSAQDGMHDSPSTPAPTPALLLSWVRPWREHLPLLQWANLVEAHLWPAWFSSFTARLGLAGASSSASSSSSSSEGACGSPQLAAALAMYSAWRPLLLPQGPHPAPPLASREDTELQLRKALTLMETGVEHLQGSLTLREAQRRAGVLLEQVHSRATMHRLSGGAGQAAGGGRSSSGYAAALLQASQAGGGAAGGGPMLGSSTVTGPSFRDLVEASAGARGLAFIPHPRRPAVDGCAVFLLGKRSVYLSQGVIFCDATAEGQYRPMALEEALALALAAAKE